jgi:hypothetical protein
MRVPARNTATVGATLAARVDESGSAGPFPDLFRFGFGRLILSRPKPAVLVLRQLARLLPWRYGNGRSARNRNGSPPHPLTARKGNRTPPARFAEVPYPIVVLTDPGFLRPSRR